MKKNLLFYVLCLFAAFSNAQTYPVQDVDECVFMSTTFVNAGTTYTPIVTNPVGSDASAEVSSISSTGNFEGVYFQLPYSIATGTVIDWSGRFYSANAGSNNSGSGRFEVRLQNSALGAAQFYSLGIFDKVGGSWQQESGTGLTANAVDNTLVDNNGGFDIIRIIAVNNPVSYEPLLFDNLELSINPNLADENADLEPGNVWLYNNREGDNKIAAASSFGASAYDTDVATPSTLGNSASTTVRYTKANSFSILRFTVPALTPPFSGTVKFRVYLDNCAPDLTNTMRIRLGDSGNANFYQTAGANVVTLTDKKWVECSFDLSQLTGSVSTDYVNFEIIVDQGDNTAKTGFQYHFDAIQGPFAGATTFTGANNATWTDNANWSNGQPNELFDATIPTGITVGIFNQQVGVNNLILEGTAGINLQGTAPELKVLGTVTEGTGNLTFRRNLTTTNWYLMSPPFGGITFSDFGLATGTDDNRGLATYNTATDNWSYKQVNINLNATSGIGYSIKPSASGNYTFTGTTINDADVTVAVVTGGNGSFNLLGNPFTASINSASFLTANTADLTSQTIWVWDQSIAPNGDYVTYVTADDFVLSPTQGFFVSANKATNLTIAKSSQTTGGTFQKGNGGKSEILLNMTDGIANRFAKLYYFDNNVTTGFDNGYDGEAFAGQPNALEVFTHLITDSQGKNYQVQSLPKNDMENLVVPVGIKAEAGKEITFTANAMNIPNGLNVYLEDRETNTFKELTSTSNYKVTLNNTLNGIGRFFLHTKSSALSTDDVALSSISVYAVNKNTLKITGVDASDGDVIIYNILGRKVVGQNFTSKGVVDVKLPNLSTGIYIVNVSTEKGNISKKIVLE